MVEVCGALTNELGPMGDLQKFSYYMWEVSTTDSIQLLPCRGYWETEEPQEAHN